MEVKLKNRERLIIKNIKFTDEEIYSDGEDSNYYHICHKIENKIRKNCKETIIKKNIRYIKFINCSIEYLFMIKNIFWSPKIIIKINKDIINIWCGKYNIIKKTKNNKISIKYKDFLLYNKIELNDDIEKTILNNTFNKIIILGNYKKCYSKYLSKYYYRERTNYYYDYKKNRYGHIKKNILFIIL